MSGTGLKVIALVSMFIDHIWRFIPDMPMWFNWIGRLSFPIFLYCCVLGYIHTSNRKRYFLRIYILSVVVSVINYIVLPDIALNSIRTIFITLIVMYIYDKFKNKDKYRWKLLGLFFGWQLLTSVALISLIDFLPEEILFLLATIFGNLLNLDGGILFILLGLSMYIFYNKRLGLIISFFVITGVYVVLANSSLLLKIADYLMWHKTLDGFYTIFTSFFNMIFGVHPMSVTNDILYGNPQWMMIFSLPIIFMYNGKKGRGLKYLFYIFYPLHIVVLYLIGQQMLIR